MAAGSWWEIVRAPRLALPPSVRTSLDVSPNGTRPARRGLCRTRSEAKKLLGNPETLFLSEFHEFLLVQNLGADDVLPLVLLALDDAVVDRAVRLAQMLGGFTGTSGTNRRNTWLGQRGARERADRCGATGFLAPARY